MTFWQAMILAVVEGVTEYLPISSTGHIILTSWWMGIESDPFVKDYTVMVQFGAIMAVVALYWRRFILNVRIYPAVVIGFLPAAVVGLLVKKHIDIILGDVRIVAWALILGGVVLILTDGWLRRRTSEYEVLEKLPPKRALMIGVFQLLAFIPGVSRSAATILGGVHQRLSLVAATEFSFFLAAPTLAGATMIKALKVWPTVTDEQIHIILWGNVVSFVVGAAAIHTFMRLIGRYGLKIYGYYRLLLGATVLAVALSGNSLNV